MADQQAHIHVMTNNPTKYEQISSYGFRGVAYTKCHILHRPLLSLRRGATGDKKGKEKEKTCSKANDKN